MNGNLVDTNVIIKLLNGNVETQKLFDSLNNIFISVITVGELFYGANKSSRADENATLFTNFLSGYPIIDIDINIGFLYGDIKVSLQKMGIHIPENDLWIAATAAHHKLNIISYDEHFDQIKKMKF